MSDYGPDDFDDIDDFEDEEEDAYVDCALMPNGQCLKAGSEECDWDCPYSHGEHYAGSNLWHKRHLAGMPVEGCECKDCIKARYQTEKVR